MTGRPSYWFERLSIVSLFPSLVVLVLFVATHQRNSVLHDEVRAWKDAAEKSPRKPRTHYNLGIAHANRGNADEAEKSFQRSIALESGFNRSKYFLAETLFQQGRYQEAIKLLIRLKQEIADAFGRRGVNEALRLKVEEIVELWRISDMLGACYYRLQEYDKALAELKAALRLKPDSSEILNHIALTYQAMGKYGKAEDAWHRALRIDPSFVLAHESLGLLYLEKLPDRRKARFHLQETLHYYPEHPEKQWIAEQVRALSGAP